MPTNPTRLRNWATLVRTSEEFQTDFVQQLASMLDYCAKRFEEYEAEIAELKQKLDT